MEIEVTKYLISKLKSIEEKHPNCRYADEIRELLYSEKSDGRILTTQMFESCDSLVKFLKENHIATEDIYSVENKPSNTEQIFLKYWKDEE